MSKEAVFTELEQQVAWRAARLYTNFREIDRITN